MTESEWIREALAALAEADVPVSQAASHLGVPQQEECQALSLELYALREQMRGVKERARQVGRSLALAESQAAAAAR